MSSSSSCCVTRTGAKLSAKRGMGRRLDVGRREKGCSAAVVFVDLREKGCSVLFSVDFSTWAGVMPLHLLLHSFIKQKKNQKQFNVHTVPFLTCTASASSPPSLLRWIKHARTFATGIQDGEQQRRLIGDKCLGVNDGTGAAHG